MAYCEIQEPVLVTGGTGFLGSCIARKLIDQGYKAVVSVSCNPPTKSHEGVKYRIGNIKDGKFLASLFNEVKPRTVIHTAGPNWRAHKDSVYAKDDVDGTKALLQSASKCSETAAFVFTSSAYVQAGKIHKRADETGPLVKPEDGVMMRAKTKAQAEKLVLEANGRDLRTVALRLPIILGKDCLIISEWVNKGRFGYTSYGTGNLFDFVSVPNAVKAHILAAKILSDTASSDSHSEVAGKAFHITDDQPMDTTEFLVRMWNAAGHGKKTVSQEEFDKNMKYLDENAKRKKRLVLGQEVNMITSPNSGFLSFIWKANDVLLNVRKLGPVSPESSLLIELIFEKEHTYNIKKAKSILGYEPVVDTAEAIDDAVAWEVLKRT